MKTKFILVIWALMTTGCISAMTPSPSNHAINQSWQTTDIKQEIVKLESGSLSDPKDMFLLALLHTHPHNSHPDFRAARTYLNRYLTVLSEHHSSQWSDWRAQHIHHLLETIQTLEETIGRSQSRTEVLTWEQTDCQEKHAECIKKLKGLRWALKKSKKTATSAQQQLKDAQTLSEGTENEIDRLASENMKLKIQLKKLTDLYINLEKKRQAIQ